MSRPVTLCVLAAMLLAAGCALAAESRAVAFRGHRALAQGDLARRPGKAAAHEGEELDEAVLETIRARHNLPALAAAVVRDGRVLAVGAVGVRKAGSDVRVTTEDCFHIGSCTKAMTATLVEMLVEQGKLAWSATLAEVFPDLADAMRPEYRKVALHEVLAHRAGLPGAADSWPKGMSFLDVHRLPGLPRDQRREYLRRILAQEPAATPGETFLYSNAGYALLGAAAEKAADTPWETLMRDRVFKPLGMTSAGFGSMGTPGRIDQPWQHRAENGRAVPVEPGPLSDNPASIGPGGTVHCSVGDWAKFVAAHLAGARGRPTPLPVKDWSPLHTPAFGGDYAGGWTATDRPWGGGRVYTHAGSNTMNYAVVWMAPLRNFAVVVATNQGGDAAPKACDEVAAAMVRTYCPNEGSPK